MDTLLTVSESLHPCQGVLDLFLSWFSDQRISDNAKQMLYAKISNHPGRYALPLFVFKCYAKHYDSFKYTSNDLYKHHHIVGGDQNQRQAVYDALTWIELAQPELYKKIVESSSRVVFTTNYIRSPAGGYIRYLGSPRLEIPEEMRISKPNSLARYPYTTVLTGTHGLRKYSFSSNVFEFAAKLIDLGLRPHKIGMESEKEVEKAFRSLTGESIEEYLDEIGKKNIAFYNLVRIYITGPVIFLTSIASLINALIKRKDALSNTRPTSITYKKISLSRVFGVLSLVFYIFCWAQVGLSVNIPAYFLWFSLSVILFVIGEIILIMVVPYIIPRLVRNEPILPTLDHYEPHEIPLVRATFKYDPDASDSSV